MGPDLRHSVASVVVALVLLIAGGPGSRPLTAQERDQKPLLSPGDELRIASPNYTGPAVHLGGTADSLTLLVQPYERVVRVSLGSIQRIERRERVPRGRRALRGALFGAAGGVAYGSLGIVLAERGPGDPPEVWWPVLGAAYLTLPTALVFALVPEYEWEVLPLPAEHPTVRLAALPNGFALRLRW